MSFTPFQALGHRPLALGHGPWAVGLGPWALGHGPWAMGPGPWAMGHGPWAMGCVVFIWFLARPFRPAAVAEERVVNIYLTHSDLPKSGVGNGLLVGGLTKKSTRNPGQTVLRNIGW